MKYMMLVYLDEKAWGNLTAEEQRVAMDECTPHMKDLVSKGKFLGGAPLQPTTTASTVRVREGKRLVTDGPFAETREQLGGYGLIDANDHQDAIEIAAGFIGSGKWSTIEVRPLVEFASAAT